MDFNRYSGFTTLFPRQWARDMRVPPWSCSTTELQRQIDDELFYTRDLFRAETGVILRIILCLSLKTNLSPSLFITIKQIDMCNSYFALVKARNDSYY